MEKISLVVDSLCDITEEDAQKYGVIVSYITVLWKNENDDIIWERRLPNNEINRKKLYNLTSVHSRISTHGLTMNDADEIYFDVLPKCDKILFLVSSLSLTGSYQNIDYRFKSLDPEKLIAFDTRTTSGGTRLLLDQLLVMREHNRPIEEMFAFLENKINKIGSRFYTMDNHYFEYNGRMKTGIIPNNNLKTLFIGRLTDGKCVFEKQTTSEKLAIKHILDNFVNEYDDSVFCPIYITTPNGESADCVELKQKIMELKPNAVIVTNPVSPTLCVHTGEKIIGVTYLKK